MYLAEFSRLAARGTAMLLLAPSATFTWDASAQPPVSLERLAVAARLAPRDPLAHCEYGKALAKSNQLSKARTELEACVSLDPDSVEGHFRLARLYRQLGLTALAKEQADRRTHAEQHESARNEERYRNATAFLFTMQKLDSKP